MATGPDRERLRRLVCEEARAWLIAACIVVVYVAAAAWF